MRKILLVAIALAAAACGGGADSDGVASLESDTDILAADPNAGTETETTALDDEEALLAFTQCLRDQGLDVADPEVDADGNLRLGGRPQGQEQDFDREAFAAARDACGDLLEGVSFGFQEFDRTEIEDTLIEFASCMRDNGVDLPDPDFSATPGPGGGGPFGDIDPTDPAFQAASDTCQDILAGAFGGEGPPGGGPPGGSPGGGGDA